MILIGGNNPDAKDTDKYKTEGNFLVRNDSVILKIDGMAQDLTNNLNVFVVHDKPKKHKYLAEYEIISENGFVYVGNIHKTNYLIFSTNKQKINFGVFVDSKTNLSSISLYFNDAMKLEETSVDIKYEEVKDKIQKLGEKVGCHVCGKKTGKFKSQLIPPDELNSGLSQNWYPICEQDFEKYIAALQQKLLKDII